MLDSLCGIYCTVYTIEYVLLEERAQKRAVSKIQNSLENMYMKGVLSSLHYSIIHHPCLDGCYTHLSFVSYSMIQYNNGLTRSASAQPGRGELFSSAFPPFLKIRSFATFRLLKTIFVFCTVHYLILGHACGRQEVDEFDFLFLTLNLQRHLSYYHIHSRYHLVFWRQEDVYTCLCQQFNSDHTETNLFALNRAQRCKMRNALRHPTLQYT